MEKATYVDGFVLVIPEDKVEAYRKMATEACEVWMRFGALSYRENIIDDAQPKDVTFTFPKMAQAEEGETVWFSYIEFKDRAHRDEVNKKVMEYFDEKYKDDSSQEDMPFDMKRMAYAGFKVEISN